MGKLNFRNPLNFGSSSAIIAEGLEDWNEIKAARTAYAVQSEEIVQKRRIRAAKAYATAYGIRNWSVFMADKCYQPSREAMVAAEAVLTPIHGAYGSTLPDGSRSRGGFDSYSCHGLSGSDVRALWFIAGCKDSSKFRFMVKHWDRWDQPFKKGDSFPFCINYLRGWRWLSANKKFVDRNGEVASFSRKAIAALGRLSPIARRAAVDGVRLWDGNVGAVNTPIRIRELNWDAVKRSQVLQCTGSAKVKLALQPPRAIIKEVTGQLPPVGKPIDPLLLNAAIAALVPHYAMDRSMWDMGHGPVSLQDAKDLVLGKKTIGMCVAGGQFTDKLATVFLKEHNCPGYIDPMGWYADRVGVPQHRSIRVMDWMSYLKKKGWWNEMEKERVQHVGGQEHRFNAMQLLDEIQAEDVITGKEGVSVVLRRASERSGEAFYQKYKGDYKTLRHGLPQWTKRLPRWIRVLNTAAELANEGRDLKHCVGGYLEAVRSGRCIILAINSRHGRSTIEISDGLVIMQHRGVSNGAPPSRHDQLLRAFCNRVR